MNAQTKHYLNFYFKNQMKTSEEIRKSFIDFWSSSPRNAKQVANVSVVPNNDPSLLFVNSGMFPLVPYLAGEEHPLGKRIFNIQRCVRTNDIDEVGDHSHLTLFEMIGNWSLGDFPKEEQIPWMFELYIEKFGLDPHRCYVSVWTGNDVVGRDEKAIEVWKKVFRKYGIEAEFSEDRTMVAPTVEESKDWKYRIFPYGKKENWWQRGPDVAGELGGPTTELFYDLGTIQYPQDEYHINGDSGRFLEVGNSVFMEYKFGEDGKWHELPQKNIDFGGGFERIVVAAQDKLSVYETDIFEDYFAKLEELSGKKYDHSRIKDQDTLAFRIVTEHSRSASFILADGVRPGNKDQGYILRRLIRRMIRQGIRLGINENFTTQMAEVVIKKMSEAYPMLIENKAFILEQFEQEETKFRRTIEKGLKEMHKMIESKEELSGDKAFYIYETYGFPLELTLEEFSLTSEEKKKITDEFLAKEESHKALSRSGAEKKFTGGLADQSEMTTRLHTTHHLLLGALREVLGSHVHQKGSNITSERLRIDFSHADKLSDEQISEVERIVNEKISEGWNVVKKALPMDVAKELGAEMEFGAKYGDMVNVYFVVNPTVSVDRRNPNIESIPSDMIYSKEFCGGPHVENTSEIGKSGKFKIDSEKSNGSGVRRIKAVLI
jgi:alanyl-tRNA synthetase